MSLHNRRLINLLDFKDNIENIIEIYTDGSGEALDGDEVDVLIEHLRNRINLHQGNITDEEFEDLENNLKGS